MFNKGQYLKMSIEWDKKLKSCREASAFNSDTGRLLFSPNLTQTYGTPGKFSQLHVRDSRGNEAKTDGEKKRKESNIKLIDNNLHKHEN